MWEYRNGILNNIKSDIINYNKGNFWQIDQNFLREKIYPKVLKISFVHDSFFNIEKNRKPFPQERINKEFVGDVFDENNVRHPEYYKFL